MKILKSKTWIGLICLLLATGISFGLLPKLSSQKSETVEVIRAKQEIPAGTTLTEELLTITEIGSYGLPEQVARGTDAVVGAVATEPIHKGELLWKSTLQNAADYATRLEETGKGLEDGLCLIAVRIPSISAGVADLLHAGCAVDIYATITDETGHVTIQKVLGDMELYEVLNAGLQSIDELPIPTDDSGVDTVPCYLVFRTNEEKAMTLIGLEKTQTLYLTLVKTEVEP